MVDAPRSPAAAPRLPATPRGQAARLPPGPGVYRFRDAAGRVLYLGRAVSLRRRVASYWGNLGDRGHLATMVARIARVEAVPCASAHEAAWLERNLLERGKPPWNRSASGGQESEVWIRLAPSGLTVIRHPRRGDPARYFGPYLGGQKAREAVSGLQRVLPLGHAADQSAGAAHELAQARAVSPAVRADLARACGVSPAVRADLARACGVSPAVQTDHLAGTAAAVLDRDPAAVTGLRAELIRRRDAAAARLAFEFAGRVQAELEALDWITAQQMVTSPRPCDFDVHGWADGVLVRFEVRGGRLSGWSQRACPAAVARPDAPGDDGPAWADFACRTAELAALLAS
jgi:excinuclease ABC subunit C